MKVLVANWRDIENPEAGGAEVHIDEILKRKPSGWNIDFISAAFPGCQKQTEINGYRIKRIPNNLFFHYTFRNFWNRELKNNNYDLVIDDISKIPLATPKYIHNTRIVGIVHHLHGKSLYQQLSWPLAFYVSRVERSNLVAYRKTPVIVVSESTKNELKNLYNLEHLILSHNGIHFNRYNHSRRPAHFKQPVVFYFGRLKKYKRIDHLILAFAEVHKKIPASRLWIAGKGDDEQRLKKIMLQKGLSSCIEFLGYIDEKDKCYYLEKASIYATASEKEGWGISVIEANAAGLPAVAYDVEGLRDSIRDMKTGLLAQNGSIIDLAEKMEVLLINTPLREKMSEAAVKWASAFSWDKAANDFFNICSIT